MSIRTGTEHSLDQLSKFLSQLRQTQKDRERNDSDDKKIIQFCRYWFQCYLNGKQLLKW